MNCKCEPDSQHFPDNPNVSTIYFIPCKFCGHHLYIRKKGDLQKIRVVEILPKGQPLNLRFDKAATDYEIYQKYRNAYDLQRPLLSESERKNTLYEAVADGDISIDEFNKYIYRDYGDSNTTGSTGN